MSGLGDKLWRSAQRAKRRREKQMPDERAAIAALFDAWVRLKDLGWREAEYCPKDGTVFDAIEVGSIGIHACHYQGTWPTGTWWVSDGNDLWPASPCLFRLQETAR